MVSSTLAKSFHCYNDRKLLALARGKFQQKQEVKNRRREGVCLRAIFYDVNENGKPRSSRVDSDSWNPVK